MERIRMTGRDINERHRPATTLELFFDLIIVVAVASAADGLHHAITEGHVMHGIFGYMVSFFAIWLAWLNFSWFASAYDTDDTRYRITTFVQMVGCVILAVGIGDIFHPQPSFVIALIGYIIMRIAMVSQWLRAAKEHQQLRKTCLTYAFGISAAQLGWLLLVFLPVTIQQWAVFLLMAAELAVPYWAERTKQTPWHPHHIAERYGLLVIITLGECIAGTIYAITSIVHEGGVTDWLQNILPLSFGTMALAFAFWWIYFSHSYGNDLENNRARAFSFGYIHYFVFASLAAVGTGMELLADSLAHHGSPILSFITIAIASSIYLLMILLMRFSVRTSFSKRI